MTTKANYTPEEWEILCDAPLAVGGAVATSAPSGVVGTIKEGIAIVNSMLRAAQQYPHNQLIQEVVPKGVSREQIDSWADTARGMIQQSEAARVKTMGMDTCRKVDAILQTKGEPQEAEEYKMWLLEMGKDVAQSANEGGNFMNTGGVAISQQETQTLNDMASALGVSQQVKSQTRRNS